MWNFPIIARYLRQVFYSPIYWIIYVAFAASTIIIYDLADNSQAEKEPSAPKEETAESAPDILENKELKNFLTTIAKALFEREIVAIANTPDQKETAEFFQAFTANSNSFSSVFHWRYESSDKSLEDLKKELVDARMIFDFREEPEKLGVVSSEAIDNFILFGTDSTAAIKQNFELAKLYQLADTNGLVESLIRPEVKVTAKKSVSKRLIKEHIGNLSLLLLLSFLGMGLTARLLALGRMIFNDDSSKGVKAFLLTMYSKNNLMLQRLAALTITSFIVYIKWKAFWLIWSLSTDGEIFTEFSFGKESSAAVAVFVYVTILNLILATSISGFFSIFEQSARKSTKSFMLVTGLLLPLGLIFFGFFLTFYLTLFSFPINFITKASLYIPVASIPSQVFAFQFGKAGIIDLVMLTISYLSLALLLNFATSFGFDRYYRSNQESFWGWTWRSLKSLT